MPALRDDEVRRLISFLSKQIQDVEQLAFIEDELRGEYGAEFLRELYIQTFFPTEVLEIVFEQETWQLKIISYTFVRMVQRGIKQDEILSLFEKFLAYCKASGEVITVGAYTIYGKPEPRSSAMTLRIDVDEISQEQNKAHTVTVFFGRGDSSFTNEIEL